MKVASETVGCAHSLGQIWTLGFDFLKAHDVRIVCPEPIEAAFVDGGTDAVKIESGNAHECMTDD